VSDAAIHRTPPVPADDDEHHPLHLWQRGERVRGTPILTTGLGVLVVVALAGVALAALRIVNGALGTFSGMSDFYAWGIWKTFNVMALTALGSGGLAVGVSVWVFGRRELHTVMRTAVLTSLLFYFAGLAALMTDVGRPWNFWHIAVPWHWNTRSSLWEVSLAMPLYAAVFLLYEFSPTIAERFAKSRSPRLRALVVRLRPRMRPLYPWMVAGAYVLPMVHQSSLGALMLLGGDKVCPLWQSEMLPALYLLQAGVCGFGAVIVFVMTSCLVWRRPLDTRVLAELANLMSWLILGWTAIRFGDLAVHGKLALLVEPDPHTLLFAVENVMILVPALVLRSARMRTTPRVVFQMAVLATLGGLLYRFIPTTIAYLPGNAFAYFPTVPEILVSFGLVAAVVAAFGVAVKVFAVLPAPVDDWWARTVPPRRRD
jgi:Ni/Fe-hydrogenase subunit HybB-like protein